MVLEGYGAKIGTWFVGRVADYATGKVLDKAFGGKGDIRAAIFACFDRAVDEWCQNKQIREKYYQRGQFLFDDLVAHVKGNGGMLDSEIMQLVLLWEEEIENDPIAIHWLQLQYLKSLSEGQKADGRVLEVIRKSLDWIDKQSETLQFKTAGEMLRNLEEEYLKNIEADEKLEKHFYWLKAKCLLFKDIKTAQEAYAKSDRKDDTFESLISSFKQELVPDDWNGELPNNLIWANLPQWVQMTFHYQVKYMACLLLVRDETRKQEYRQAHEHMEKFLTLLDKTEVAKSFAVYRALDAYIACAAGIPGDWIKVHRESMAELPDRGDYMTLAEVSMLMMEGRVHEARTLIEGIDLEELQNQSFAARMGLICKDLGVFEKIFSDCKDSGRTVSTDTCSQICMYAERFTSEDFLKKLSECTFENEADRVVVVGTIAKKAHQGVRMLTQEEIASVSESLHPYMAVLMAEAGQEDEARAILESHVEIGRAGIKEEAYLNVLKTKDEWRPELMRWLRVGRDSFRGYGLMWLIVEFEMEWMMGDYPNAKTTAKILYADYPDVEIALVHYLSSLSIDKDPELEQLKDKVIGFKFEMEESVDTVYGVYYQSDYKSIAAEILYQNTMRMNTTYLKNKYLGQSMQWGEDLMGDIGGVIADGSYVLIDDGGQRRRCEKVDGSSKLGKALIGHTSGDIVTYDVGVADKEVKIVEIVSKYHKLFADLTIEYSQNGGNEGVQFFSFENSDNIGQQFMRLVQRLNPGYEEQQKEIERTKREYQHGDTGMCKIISNNKCYEDYARLLFGSESVYVYNPDAFDDLIVSESTRWVLDLPSIMLLCAFSRETGYCPSRKFLIASRVNTYIQDNCDKYCIAELENICAWVAQNCDVEVPANIEAVLKPHDTDLQMLVMHSLCFMLMTDNVLISDDNWYVQVPGMPCRTLSVEAYMKRYEPKIVSDRFHEFVIKLGYEYYE